MEDKRVSEIQQLIGLPEYTLLQLTSDTKPLEAWVPPTGRPIFSADDMYRLFANECTAFAGDSTGRRAADTLHSIIEHRNDPSSFHSRYIYNWTRVQGYHTRIVGKGDPSLEKEQYYKLKCQPGTIDNVWKPQLRQFKTFKYEKKYSILLVGAGAWDLQSKKQMLPREIEEQINGTIHKLHDSIPPSVLILWKSTAFNRKSPWSYIEPDETIKRIQGGVNYLVYHANVVAKREIQRINSRRLIFLDWAKEVFPHMYNSNTSNLMLAENHDNNPWHFGPIPRGLLLHMMAWEVHSWKSQQQQQQRESISPHENTSTRINTIVAMSPFPPRLLNRTERWEEVLNQAASKSVMRGSFMQVIGVILFMSIGTVRIIRSGIRKAQSKTNPYHQM